MWIGKRFKKFAFSCPDGTQWKVGKKISEKENESYGDLYERGLDTSEAQAVHHCRQIEGPSVGRKAILKVRMQIPEVEYTSSEDEYPTSDLLDRARHASDAYGIGTSQEIHALKWFTETGCSVTPHLLHLIETF
ncbi:hypothetical protein UA08_07891 [Talaromyces atroroseus]|uniref:Uncharacterized protein n=1 Tax=Talaromyces atroroseus TaxID=1441469 RepID=A0A225APQ4_TALAT|nr:hypothetical protein UA08_07891 [Talaromyces atroroseus]OKL56936.1 hypothetical protein UA08_07891 [Talaromyces atroroseus]